MTASHSSACDRSDLERLRLETGERQHAAIRFYEKAGFHRCAAFGDYARMPPHAIATSVFFESASRSLIIGAMLDERLQDLEIKVAFQDKLIADLDALVRSLGDRLDALQREHAELKKTIASPELPLGAINERPPHY